MAKKLNDKIRADIVTMFACFATPDDVRNWLMEEHGIELAPSGFSYYNGNNILQYRKMSAKWQKLFDAMRQEYLDTVSRVPIAHKAHRLKVASDAVDRIMEKIKTGRNVNIPLVETLQRLLEYAAKEDGGMFTNTRILKMNPKDALAELLGVDPNTLPDPEDGGRY